MTVLFNKIHVWSQGFYWTLRSHAKLAGSGGVCADRSFGEKMLKLSHADSMQRKCGNSSE